MPLRLNFVESFTTSVPIYNQSKKSRLLKKKTTPSPPHTIPHTHRVVTHTYTQQQRRQNGDGARVEGRLRGGGSSGCCGRAAPRARHRSRAPEPRAVAHTHAPAAAFYTHVYTKGCVCTYVCTRERVRDVDDCVIDRGESAAAAAAAGCEDGAEAG